MRKRAMEQTTDKKKSMRLLVATLFAACSLTAFTG
jgi:hypothetical protein